MADREDRRGGARQRSAPHLGITTLGHKGWSIVKKNKAKPVERQIDGRSDAVRKQANARPPRPADDGLTCNEAQIEDLLAEGEST